jgi:hypothetical protein
MPVSRRKIYIPTPAHLPANKQEESKMEHSPTVEAHIKEVQHIRDSAFNIKALNREIGAWDDEFKKDALKLKDLGFSKDTIKKQHEILTKLFSNHILKTVELVMKAYMITGSKLVLDSALDKDLRDYLEMTIGNETYPCLDKIRDVLTRSISALEKMEEGKELASKMRILTEQTENCMKFLKNYLIYLKRQNKDFDAARVIKSSIKEYNSAAGMMRSVTSTLPWTTRWKASGLRKEAKKHLEASLKSLAA